MNLRDNVKMVTNNRKMAGTTVEEPTAQTPSSKRKATNQKLRSVQIDLVSSQDELRQSNENNGYFKVGKLAHQDDTFDSCTEDQETARGSNNVETAIHSREKAIERPRGKKKDDLQQEKHKIWVQSILDDQIMSMPKDSGSTETFVSDPFKQPVTDQNLTLTDSDHDPYL